MIKLTLTLKMTTVQVIETSVTVNNNSLIQEIYMDDHVLSTYEMTPGFKPFTELETMIIKTDQIHLYFNNNSQKR